MSFGARLQKLAAIARRPRYLQALARHRVAATVEHLDAIRFCAPSTLIDIGANKGQFSLAVRGLFPQALVHAFEPLPAAADRYAALFAGDSRTHLHRVAIGAEPAMTTFHVTDREDSSSLLKPGQGQLDAFGVAAKREIEVRVEPLGNILDLANLPRPIMIKIDVQGAELAVLRGLTALTSVDHIYVELSFVELYDGQPLFEDVRSHLAARGFDIRGTFNQAITQRFGPTQVDCLFVRERASTGTG